MSCGMMSLCIFEGQGIVEEWREISGRSECIQFCGG